MILSKIKFFLPPLLALAACRPDQVRHLPGTKQIAEETANWEAIRITPNDLLHATRWAGDSLTAYADTLLRRTLARELTRGSLVQAAAFCRPQSYPPVDSMARKWHATPRRVEWQAPPAGSAPAASAAAGLRPDTLRLIGRPAVDTFYYQRPITLATSLCRRCHGQPGQGLTTAEARMLQARYPGLRAVGRQPGGARGLAAHAGPRRGSGVLHHEKPQEVEGAQDALAVLSASGPLGMSSDLVFFRIYF